MSLSVAAETRLAGRSCARGVSFPGRRGLGPTRPPALFPPRGLAGLQRQRPGGRFPPHGARASAPVHEAGLYLAHEASAHRLCSPWVRSALRVQAAGVPEQLQVIWELPLPLCFGDVCVIKATTYQTEGRSRRLQMNTFQQARDKSCNRATEAPKKILTARPSPERRGGGLPLRQPAPIAALGTLFHVQ